MAFTGATAGLAAGAQTNDTRLDVALEATYATPPTGNYQALRITGETLSRSQTTARPEEINSVKEVSQSVVTQVQASGTISGALSSGTFDALLAGVMGADIIPMTTQTSGTTFFTITGSTLTISGTGTSAWMTTFVANAGTIVVNSPSNNLNNAIFAFSGKNNTAGTFSLIAGPSVTGTVKSTNGDTISVGGCLNGNLDKTFTVRKKLLGQFLMYPGSLVSQAQFQFQQAQFDTVSIDIISADEVLSAVDVSTAVLPAPSGKVHNSVNNFLGVTINGNKPAGCVTQFTCTLARNGAANDYGMGHTGACGVRTGQFMASGSIEFFFRSWDEYNDALNGTQGEIIIQTVDDSGNGYAFVFLNAALRNAKVNSSQTNQTVKVSFDIEGNPTASGGTFAIVPLSGVAVTGS
ncbi:phage tail protein [Acetobacter oryzifermentans]|uniref:Phage tail protein n=3 Tax=Acetobacter TaxID=434 RepID=A0AAN1U9M2_9PROT|nr:MULTISPECIES: phage tail tube protein [Acetobacter]ASL39470.1 phage tail protein [Acetobacter oryzifermentans]AXN01101.1 phage tail protein [Acetobacter pomorum]